MDLPEDGGDRIVLGGKMVCDKDLRTDDLADDQVNNTDHILGDPAGDRNDPGRNL